MNGQSAFCLGNDFKQQPWLNRHFGSIHRLRFISDDNCLWCWIAPVCPSMPQWNLSIVYWPECQQAWRLRAGKVSKSVVGENCGTWMCPWFQYLRSPSGLMPPIDVVVSCRIWSLTHPFEEKHRMGRVPFAWETISINSFGSTDTLGASTGWDIWR